MDENKEDELKAEMAKIVKGLELTYERLIKYKRSINSPLVVSKNGEVVEMDPHEAPSSTKYKWH